MRAGDRFYQAVYDNCSIPARIRGMFVGRSREEQYQVLRHALWLLLTYAEKLEQGEPTILSGIARTHAQYEPQQFDTFGEAVLKAVDGTIRKVPPPWSRGGRPSRRGSTILRARRARRHRCSGADTRRFLPSGQSSARSRARWGCPRRSIFSARDDPGLRA